jgi:hypothetical protein
VRIRGKGMIADGKYSILDLGFVQVITLCANCCPESQRRYRDMPNVCMFLPQNNGSSIRLLSAEGRNSEQRLSGSVARCYFRLGPVGFLGCPGWHAGSCLARLS